MVKTGALKISDITWRMASLAEAPPQTKMRVPFAEMRERERERKLASDVDDEMTNNGRSRRKRGREGETGEFAFLAVGRMEERGKWMLPLRAKLQSPSMGLVLGWENCDFYRVCMSHRKLP